MKKKKLNKKLKLKKISVANLNDIKGDGMKGTLILCETSPTHFFCRTHFLCRSHKFTCNGGTYILCETSPSHYFTCNC